MPGHWYEATIAYPVDGTSCADGVTACPLPAVSTDNAIGVVIAPSTDYLYHVDQIPGPSGVASSYFYLAPSGHCGAFDGAMYDGRFVGTGGEIHADGTFTSPASGSPNDWPGIAQHFYAAAAGDHSHPDNVTAHIWVDPVGWIPEPGIL